MFKKINLLRPILVILILFIPLYPKFPLASVNGTYVAIRLDDIVVALSLLVFLIYQLKNGFPIFKEKITYFFIAYFIAIFISFLNAYLVFQTEPIQILLLHLLRRIEYTSLFFLTFSAVKKPSDLKYVLISFIVAALGIAIYGYGQKYLHFPVISTMNEEFSKGQLLRMDVWTRISSTFAGHYDLAAYLSVFLVVFGGVVILLKNVFLKISGIIFWLILFQMLSLTASRVSNFAYFGGFILAIILIRKYFWILPVSLIFAFSLFNSKDLNQRLIATIPSLKNRFVTQSPTSIPIPTPTTIEIPTSITPPIINLKITPIPPTPTVFRHPPIQEFIPIDADVGVARSGEIRFNVEWPRALNAYKASPLVGTGLGSISLATDNDYLRLLGESGLVGLITFLFIPEYFIFSTLKYLFIKKLSLPDSYLIIFLAGLVTFMVNATLIDVFEASKPAYLFWIMMGLYYSLLKAGKTMSNYQKILITLILFFGVLLRLYKINSPVADWHSHRQADTASVTRNILKSTDNIFLPRYHDLSDVQSGKLNPQGYRLVEFPVYNLISAAFSKIFSQNVDLSQRIISILFSLGSGLLIFLIVNQITSQYSLSCLSLLLFLFLPFNIYYSRVILPEPAAVFFMLVCIYFFDTQKILSGLALALGILIKPYIAIILFPYLTYHSYRFVKLPSLKKLFQIFIFLLLSFAPFILWRFWINQFPEGIPDSAWLFNNNPKRIIPEWVRGVNMDWFNRLNFTRPFWFNWIFKQRLTDLILGTFGIIPFFIGFYYRKNQLTSFLNLTFSGILLYFIIVSGGNIQHDYYQILIIPFVSIAVASGFIYIYRYLGKSKRTTLFISLLIGLIAWYLSADQIIKYYKINRPEIILAGNKVSSLTPENSLIIAPYQGDTSFLYQTQRSGFPTEIYDIENLKLIFSDRPFYLVSVNFDNYTNSIAKMYSTIYRDSNFIILDLNHENQ